MEILSDLAGLLTLPDASQLTSSADALDAVVCLLATKDFLDGRAMEPIDTDLACQEGWIWTAPLAAGNVSQLQQTPERRSKESRKSKCRCFRIHAKRRR